jgi:HIT domain
MFERYELDLEAQARRVRTSLRLRYPGAAPAFSDQHIIYEDEGAIVFLAMDPTRYGYMLVAPKEQVAGDFTVEEYLDLQRVVHRVAEGVGCTGGDSRRASAFTGREISPEKPPPPTLSTRRFPRGWPGLFRTRD